MMLAARDTCECSAAGPLHAQSRDGLPGQLPGEGVGRGALAGHPARLLPRGLRADKAIAGWPEAKYLFFVGCFFALNGVIETSSWRAATTSPSWSARATWTFCCSSRLTNSS